MKKTSAIDPRSKKHLELFRQENKHYESLLKLLNIIGSSAEKLRQALDGVDRGASVAQEIRKARDLIEAELGRTNGPDAPPLPAKFEAAFAALVASNAKLFEGVQQQARESQLLLCRSLAVMQAVISALSAGKATSGSEPASTGSSEVQPQPKAA